jgi:hypothetical protein
MRFEGKWNWPISAWSDRLLNFQELCILVNVMWAVWYGAEMGYSCLGNQQIEQISTGTSSLFSIYHHAPNIFCSKYLKVLKVNGQVLTNLFYTHVIRLYHGQEAAVGTLGCTKNYLRKRKTSYTLWDNIHIKNCNTNMATLRCEAQTYFWSHLLFNKRYGCW